MNHPLVPIFMFMAILLLGAFIVFLWLRKRLWTGRDEESSPESLILATPTSTLREFARAEVRMPVIITTPDGRESNGESRNISATGIFVSCETTIKPGTVCGLKLLSAATGPIEFKGRVTWSNQHLPKEKVCEPGVGFGFFALEAETRKKLARILQENLEEEER